MIAFQIWTIKTSRICADTFALIQRLVDVFDAAKFTITILSIVSLDHDYASLVNGFQNNEQIFSDPEPRRHPSAS